MDTDAFHAQVVDQYSQHINPALAKLMNFAGFGVEVRGEGCYLFDHEGRQYLDCLGSYGVFSLGHRHPKVVEAVTAQLNALPMSGKVFFNPRQAELATRLAAISPNGLELCFFSNSGAEAVEAALKFAKGATGRTKIISTVGSFHGKTLGTLSVTGREKYRRMFDPLMPGAEFVRFPSPQAGASAWSEIVNAIDSDTAAVIIETVQGEGGIHLAAPGALPAIRARTREVGALMIVDEVQTGMGRTGRLFGCDHEGIEPDIMTLAKALGGGVMPIGATLFTESVGSAIFSENPLMHTSTFGGNPLACAAGIATLDVIEAEGLCERARLMGEKMMAGLREMQSRHSDLVSEVRGIGLMIGVEFSMDEVGELVIAQMTKRGVIAAYTLNNPRVIRIEPPLIISEAQVDEAVRVFDEAITETGELLAMIA